MESSQSASYGGQRLHGDARNKTRRAFSGRIQTMISRTAKQTLRW